MTQTMFPRLSFLSFFMALAWGLSMAVNVNAQGQSLVRRGERYRNDK